MRPTVLNRDFQHPADGWYQIEVPGEHPNSPAGLVQVIDEQAVDSIVNRFNQEAAGYQQRTGQPFPGMLIDHEHFKHDADKESVAYGWLMRLENRNGVPFGQIKWTATGQPAVDGGDYRFFSTEYAPKDLQILNAGQSPKRVRPLRLDGLTLTNEPNNKGGSPITNRNQFGNFATQADFNAARDENTRHVEANKAAAAKQEAERQASSEGEAAELAVPALEKFCRAVKNVMDAAARTSHHMMPFPAAWTYAKQKFPELYAAAFEFNATADPSTAVRQVTDIANRVGRLAGKGFNFGFNFVHEELPHVFNRMTPAAARIDNRARFGLPDFSTQGAAKVFNRLVRAESVVAGLPDHQAWRMVASRHPGLYGLAEGKLLPSEALASEPGLSALLK